MRCAKCGINQSSCSGDEDENFESLQQLQRRQRQTTDNFNQKT